MKKHSIYKGFTLIEVLIYITLFGILMSGAVVSAYQLLQSGEHQTLTLDSQQEGAFVNRKLAWALEPATAVSVSGGNKMTITRSDIGTITIDGSGSRLTLARGSSTALPLTASGLALSNVSFSVTPQGGGLPEAVHASYTLGGQPFTYAMYLRQ